MLQSIGQNKFMKPQMSFLSAILGLVIAILSTSYAEAQVFKQDPKYASYNQFFSFDLKVTTDYESNKKYLVLESKIVESTMHTDSEGIDRQPQPTAKKFYKKLELYYNRQSAPSVVMDLTPLRLENSIGAPPVPINDGYIADSLEIKLGQTDLKNFLKLKPADAHVVFYDGEGKVVTSASANITIEQ